MRLMLYLLATALYLCTTDAESDYPDYLLNEPENSALTLYWSSHHDNSEGEYHKLFVTGQVRFNPVALDRIDNRADPLWRFGKPFFARLRVFLNYETGIFDQDLRQMVSAENSLRERKPGSIACFVTSGTRYVNQGGELDRYREGIADYFQRSGLRTEEEKVLDAEAKKREWEKTYNQNTQNQGGRLDNYH